MHWSNSLLSSAQPLHTLRRDFERKLGLDADSIFAGMTVTESADGYQVKVDVPGMQDQDISISLHDDQLVIEGERKAALTDGTKELYNDRTFRRFRRVLRLQEPVDKSSIEAELNQGVLTLKLRRIPEAQPTKINIRTVS